MWYDEGGISKLLTVSFVHKDVKSNGENKDSIALHLLFNAH